MNTTQIAVIIPVYNDEYYLEKALASLFLQEFKDFKVIVIDDCSSNSKKIKQICKDSKIDVHYMCLPRNMGPGVARQHGIDYAIKYHIPFVTFLDADDMFLPHALDRLWTAATISNANIVAAPCLSEVFSDGQEVEVMSDKASVTWVTGKLYRTEFLEAFNIKFHPTIRDHEDLYFNTICYSLCDGAQIVPIEEPLHYFRMRKDSYTRRIGYVNMFVSYIEAACEAFKFLLDNGHENTMFKAVSNVFFMYDYYEVLKVLGYDKLEDIDEILTSTFSKTKFLYGFDILDFWQANEKTLNGFEFYNQKIEVDDELPENMFPDHVLLYPDSFYQFLVNHGCQIQSPKLPVQPYEDYQGLIENMEMQQFLGVNNE